MTEAKGTGCRQSQSRIWSLVAIARTWSRGWKDRDAIMEWLSDCQTSLLPCDNGKNKPRESILKSISSWQSWFFPCLSPLWTTVSKPHLRLEPCIWFGFFFFWLGFFFLKQFTFKASLVHNLTCTIIKTSIDNFKRKLKHTSSLILNTYIGFNLTRGLQEVLIINPYYYYYY